MSDRVAGATAPPFALESTQGRVTLDDLTRGGRRLVLAFYLEDGTPACQTEIAMLRDAYEMIREFNAEVVAVSSDSLESHERFAERIGGVPFALASDFDLAAARAYGVVDEGDPRRSRRAVFVIDSGAIMLAIVPFQPQNLAQVEAIFTVLGGQE